MTTGRINQVSTIGGVRAPAWPRPAECGPQRALARLPSARPHAGRPRASLAGTRPRPGPGGFRRPGASPHASERASCRARGRAAHAGWPPRALARQPLACAVLAWRLAAPQRSAPRAGLGAELAMRGGPLGRSLASPGLRRPRLARPHPRLLLVHTFGAPAPPRVKPWRAPRYCQAAYCDSDECVQPVGHSQRASPGTAAPRGKTPTGYAAATARLTPRARLDATAHRRQDKDAPRPAAGPARGPATVRFAC